MGNRWHFFISNTPAGVQQFQALVGLRRNRPLLPARMMAESKGTGLDVVDDVDCIRGYPGYAG